MSYQIVYGKSFIKTPKDRIIPLTLNGANNCTEYINGREVLERNWSCFVPDFFLLLSEDEFLSACEGRYPIDTKENYEAFKAGSKWVYKNDLLKWFKNGVKNAALLENYRTKWNYPINLECMLGWWKESKFCSDCKSLIKSSAELDDWLDKAYEFKKKMEKENNISPQIIFDIRGVREPLHVQKKIEGPVVCCVRPGSYLFKYDKSGMSFSPNINTAIVFDSLEDAKNKLGEERFYRSKFVKAGNLKFKPFVIRTEKDGIYVQKRERRYLYKTSNIQSAYGFLSERAAQRYIQKLIAAYPKAVNYTVEKRNNPFDVAN